MTYMILHNLASDYLSYLISLFSLVPTPSFPPPSILHLHWIFFLAYSCLKNFLFAVFIFVKLVPYIFKQLWLSHHS